MLKSSVILFLICLTAGPAQLVGQDSTSVSSGTASTGKNIYRKAWHAGFLIHTRGIGGHYRGEVFKGSRIKNFYAIEAYNIKHIEEQKSFNPSGDQSNSFIYGKMNQVYVFKGGIGRQSIMFEKLVLRGVQISSVVGANLLFALVKPVYVNVYRFEDERQVESTERYNPYEHSYGQIIGRGPFLKGFGEAQIIPGFGLKTAMNFEFAPTDEKIKAIEVGANIDGFMKPLPLMAFNTQYSVQLTLYVNFQFGKKSFL